ncbi:retrovirus-related Pol polyprotein from transposon 297 [Caerostris darwini]|uniref:Retrovirus-related Pol polyprotein from transposon 297 n=1 Tax=Caerostris darwini TaxID=1538125 RepID=A0AAV4RPQ9_9ARAC|nr:retrovirus-related Pol polyprotein from transposon 297 [Caerostris darwini]
MRQAAQMQLFVAKGTAILTYGKRLLKLVLGLRREFNWPFIIFAVSQPIIGADFLRHFGLLVDIKNGILIVPLKVAKLKTKGTLYAGNSSSVKAIIENSKFHQVHLYFDKTGRRRCTVKSGKELKVFNLKTA